jgi:serine/threonine-protein kinase
MQSAPPSVRGARAGSMHSVPPSMHARASGIELETTPALEAALGASPRMPPRGAPFSTGTLRPPPALRPLSDRPPPGHWPQAARPPAEPARRAAPTLVQQLGLPVLCIVFACVLTVADLIMRSSGEGLSFGPVRSFWVAGVLLLFGVGLFFWRMLGDPGDA